MYLLRYSPTGRKSRHAHAHARTYTHTCTHTRIHTGRYLPCVVLCSRVCREVMIFLVSVFMGVMVCAMPAPVALLAVDFFIITPQVRTLSESTWRDCYDYVYDCFSFRYVCVFESRFVINFFFFKKPFLARPFDVCFTLSWSLTPKIFLFCFD